ncbi:hypothetical protein HMPREF3038_00169 [Akkermansia sp. KLE1797]|nr:hypothetical protein HMPREF3038_00169 [Akkermansia sp. KLE1797]KXU55206.1 hypothetical protein HMPREF3039_00609 [Akkermansia sp. KLE1798]KZA05204.1 hypothetical protein HMPREF1326_01089 [Akkermansia sp. KLE1605]
MPLPWHVGLLPVGISACTFFQSLWKPFVRKVFPRECFLAGEYEKQFVCDYLKGKIILRCPICGRELVRGLTRFLTFSQFL